MAVNRLAVHLVFISSSLFSLGQSRDQDQAVSISFDNEPIQSALLQLDGLTERQLSYNPQILPPDLTLSQSFESETPKRIISEILGSSYQLKDIGNYLIIQKAPPPVRQKATFEIKGGIRDASTGEQLGDVSIYEINSLRSTLSDKDGLFALDTETKFDEATFVISKQFYQDTIIRVSQLRQHRGPIVLKKEERNRDRNRRSIRDRVNTFSEGLAKFFTSDEARRNAQNVNFVDTRPIQLSLVPSIGTNLKMSSQIKNKVSFNIIAGYSYGVRGVELGGFYNVTREEVRGVQIGGFGNTVGGEVHGLQMGGFINTTKDYVRGFQMGGFANLASDSVNGFQMGGFTNITREMRGIQMAGFNNHTRNSAGLQMAGFINTTRGMDGLQLAGFINKAREVRGVQLSVINVADSVATGIQFGILNFSKKNGLLSPAIESDDIVPYRVAFRSGLDWLYTVLSVGANSDKYWSYGFGLGSKLFLSDKRKLFLNPELRWFHLSKGNIEEDQNNHVVRLNMNVGYQLFKHLSITGGPGLGFYSTNQFDESGMPLINITSNPISEELGETTRQQTWIGYTLGIGF